MRDGAGSQTVEVDESTWVELQDVSVWGQEMAGSWDVCSGGARVVREGVVCLQLLPVAMLEQATIRIRLANLLRNLWESTHCDS